MQNLLFGQPQLTWTNNLIILSKTKAIEEKEFYIKLSIKEKYSKRELERQINSAVYERFLLSRQKLSTMLKEQDKPAVQQINEVFRDKYIFEFLDLPENFSERI